LCYYFSYGSDLSSFPGIDAGARLGYIPIGKIMLIVKALAGTGKTTTSMFGLGQKVPATMKMSDEQKAVIKRMRSFKWQSCAAMAFNSNIAKELAQRVPSGVVAATANAFGNRAWLAHLNISNLQPNPNKNRVIYRDLAADVDRQERYKMEGDVDQLVSLCKSYLLEPDHENLVFLSDKFDIEFDLEVFEWARKVFFKGVEEKTHIDWNDQIFMPLYHGVKIPQYDHVLVDELQDLPIAKQELVFRMSRLAISGIGDENQAIYGFSGADSEAMVTFGERMKNCLSKDISKNYLGCYGYEELPLTITRRCPKAVVEYANRYVPTLRAAPNAPEGSVTSEREGEFLESMCKDIRGRMVLCRVNAPLTSLAFKMIARGRRCYIQGKDIGTGLKREVQKSDEQDISRAVSKAVARIEKKISELGEKPFVDDSKVSALQDRIMCLNILSQDCSTVSDFVAKVDGLFKESGSPNDVQLSSVHKAKGLEHKHVCIYKPSKLPMIFPAKKGKKGQTPMQIQQEKNLAYVAYTRSMDKLTIVSEEEEPKHNYKRDYDE